MAIVFDKDVCDELNNKFIALDGYSEDKYYKEDLERIKTDNVYASRFLSHQKEDKLEAAKMIESVFSWRKENGARELDYSKEPLHCLTSMYFRNTDSEGRDILWVEPKHFDRAHRSAFEKYLIWLVEKRRGEADCSQITIVLSLDGVGLTEADVEYIKYFIGIFMYYTADVMKTMYVHNMHWLLNGIWKIVSVLLSEGAKKRVVFVKGKEIFDHLPEASVCAACGGPDPTRYKA